MRKCSKSETCFFSTETIFYLCKVLFNIKLREISVPFKWVKCGVRKMHRLYTDNDAYLKLQT